MSKKLIALLLVSMLAAMTFIACEPKDKENGDDTTVETTDDSAGTTEDTTEDNTGDTEAE